MKTALSEGLVRCHECGLTQPFVPGSRCSRCDSQLHQRIPNSLQKTWAYLITATILLFPANLLPISISAQAGNLRPDTIFTGVIELADTDIMIAAIVFIASIMVPVLKIVGILVILLSIQLRWKISHRQRLYMFKAIDVIGKWSMVDLFVISLMVAVMDRGTLLSFVPGPAATAFASVVLLTLLAAKSFDTRLMWDLEQDDDWLDTARSEDQK